MEIQGLIKCHKCRHTLLDDLRRISVVVCEETCDSYNTKKFIYISEDKLPDWIKNKVEEEQWTKGKIHCEHCKSKVGTFDFISGRKCECGTSVLPAVHFVASQVDRPIAL